jgi:hypothetical protein
MEALRPWLGFGATARYLFAANREHWSKLSPLQVVILIDASR